MESIMRTKTGFKLMAGAVVILLLLGLATPPGLQAQQRTCEQALERCLQVAAAVGGFVYQLFCAEGYLFCKKYVKV
jgi:hypothetical protein